MRTRTAILTQSVILFAFLVCAQTTFAQSQFGGYIGLGGQSISPGSGGILIPMGLFYDHAIHKATAGADLRFLGGGSGDFQGWGIGPRFTLPVAHGALTPYAECLLGTAHISHDVTVSGKLVDTQPSAYQIGMSVGTDINSGKHVGLRFNYDYGYAGGSVATTYSAFSVAVVFRINTR